jgi:hypothetical protein
MRDGKSGSALIPDLAEVVLEKALDFDEEPFDISQVSLKNVLKFVRLLADFPAKIERVT